MLFTCSLLLPLNYLPSDCRIRRMNALRSRFARSVFRGRFFLRRREVLCMTGLLLSGVASEILDSFDDFDG
jgi:hypothetical protein